MRKEQNKNNAVDNLLAENLEKVRLQSQNLKLQDNHGQSKESDQNQSIESESPETNHNNTLCTIPKDRQKLQLKVLNDKIISLQNLAIIYQDQYVARRNAKQIPHYFTKVVEARFAHHVRRSFEVWLGTLRRQQIINMMTDSRKVLNKRKVCFCYHCNLYIKVLPYIVYLI